MWLTSAIAVVVQSSFPAAVIVAFLLALAGKRSLDVAYSYAKRCGWTHVRHFWTGDSDNRGFESPAARRFGVGGVPTAFLIDPQGKIIWRGHPKDHNCETQIDGLLQICMMANSIAYSG